MSDTCDSCHEAVGSSRFQVLHEKESILETYQGIAFHTKWQPRLGRVFCSWVCANDYMKATFPHE